MSTSTRSKLFCPILNFMFVRQLNIQLKGMKSICRWFRSAWKRRKKWISSSSSPTSFSSITRWIRRTSKMPYSTWSTPDRWANLMTVIKQYYAQHRLTQTHFLGYANTDERRERRRSAVQILQPSVLCRAKIFPHRQKHRLVLWVVNSSSKFFNCFAYSLIIVSLPGTTR